MDPDSIRSAELIGVGGAKPATSRGRSAGVAEFCRFVHWKDPSQKLMDDIKDYPRSKLLTKECFQEFGGHLKRLCTEWDPTTGKKKRLPDGLEQTMINFKNAVMRMYPEWWVKGRDDEWYGKLLSAIKDETKDDWMECGLSMKKPEHCIGPKTQHDLAVVYYGDNTVQSVMQAYRSNMNKSAGEMIAITFGNVWFKILF